LKLKPPGETSAGTPFGVYAVEPRPVFTAHKSAEARRERPQAIGDSWRRP